jgi:hypothetical protein
MKLAVIVNETGSIVSTAQVGKIKAQDGHEVDFGVIAGPGQTLHEVEVPDSVIKGTATEVHEHVLRMVQPKGKQR